MGAWFYSCGDCEGRSTWFTGECGHPLWFSAHLFRRSLSFLCLYLLNINNSKRPSVSTGNKMLQFLFLYEWIFAFSSCSDLFLHQRRFPTLSQSPITISDQSYSCLPSPRSLGAILHFSHRHRLTSIASITSRETPPPTGFTPPPSTLQGDLHPSPNHISGVLLPKSFSVANLNKCCIKLPINWNYVNNTSKTGAVFFQKRKNSGDLCRSWS